MSKEMSQRTCVVDWIKVGGDNPLTIISGPCSLEDPATNDKILLTLKETCASLGLSFIFKASFDKANRTSIHSNRGLGIEKGMQEFKRLKEKYPTVPMCTDIHEPSQAKIVAEYVDLIQIPAFLCRQTDLIVAAAKTGKALSVKKGQFLSPSEMGHVVNKVREANCENLILTERGTFFGYNRLVNDFIGLGDMIQLGHPVCFDVTHSTQLPGAGKNVTAGRSDMAPLLLRASVAAGVDALFIETHPHPSEATSDGATMMPLSTVANELRVAANIRKNL